MAVNVKEYTGDGIRIKMQILLCELLFKFNVTLETFVDVVKYTFATWFLKINLFWFFNGCTVWMPHNLFNWFPVIGHLFSSKFLSIINNIMIVILNIYLVKQFLTQYHFICMENLSPNTHTLQYVYYVSSGLFFFFSISKSLHHDDEMFYIFRLFVKFTLAL